VCGSYREKGAGLQYNNTIREEDGGCYLPSSTHVANAEVNSGPMMINRSAVEA